MPGAAAEYYASQEEAASTHNSASMPEDQIELDSDSEEAPPAYSSGLGRGRTLGSDSDPQPIPTTSSIPPPPPLTSKPPSKKKFATLGDLGGSSSGGHAGHGHDDVDDDDDDENQDLFAGGEKSGLAVQNPDDLKRKIIERAKRDAAKVGGSSEPAPRTSRFTGTARTLGGDDTPSQVVEDPTANAPRRAPRVERHLHFWEDGFSVDDGPLYRSDDPANAQILAMIRAGRAPMAIMNVEKSQEVEVKLEQHQEKYKQPKKKYTPFSGGGQRLGSPAPGPGSTRESTTPSVPTNDVQAAPAAAAPEIQVNDSEPTISLQVRLGDGTRLVSRFNVTHTIGDVYSFVNSSSPSSASRDWVLMTTFPSKELTDKGQVLGDLAEFKRGGVVVQKWRT